MNNTYDVVIIGAGISGLVCGCYLAKAGKKILIIERNDHPGGCCTSFTKNACRFDSAAHSLGGMGKDGPIGRVLDDLGINNIPLKRINPSYVLRIGGYCLNIYNDFADTIHQLCQDFPEEVGQIKDFFKFVSTASSIAIIKIKNLSFEQLLNQYFNNERLKGVLYAPLLGNTGVDPTKASSFTAIKFYQQYILDGGYHLEGGMQILPDLLMKRFCEYGGEIKLCTKVEEILIENNVALGARVKDRVYYGQDIISNIDGRTTFFTLIGMQNLNPQLVKTINSLRISSSMFMLYIGLNKKLEKNQFIPEVTHWFVNDFKIAEVYENIKQDKLMFDWHAMRISKDGMAIQVFTIAPLMDQAYWEEKTSIWKEKLVEKISGYVNNFRSNIDFLMTGNPQTILNWTGNYGGATCGWESAADQFNVPGLSQKTQINNLYLTGHWTTITLGIPGVVNIGHSTAKLILNKK